MTANSILALAGPVSAMSAAVASSRKTRVGNLLAALARRAG
jgi:hypothetical protein